MTESEWLASDDPGAMLRWLDLTFRQSGQKAFKFASDRKLRLWACAISRQMVIPSSAPEIALIEDAADRGERAMEERGWGYWCNHDDIVEGLGELLRTSYAEREPEKIAALLRDIAGNPFSEMGLLTRTVPCDRCNGKGRRTPGVVCGTCEGSGETKGNADWLTWNDGLVANLAQAIYEQRAFDRLPILADALEDAGCGDEEILRHCRGEERDWHFGAKAWIAWGRKRGPCVRGCWVIDALLGLE